MKNKIIIILTVALAMLTVVSCEKETTAGFTRITYYPTLEVLGNPVVIVDKGSTYVDAGAKSILNGEDISSQVVVKSTVDTSKPGIYKVNYTVTNADGFSVQGSRTVYVKDPTPSLLESGEYTVAAGSYRLRQGTKINYSGYPIIILQMQPGVFYTTDFLGGYYEYRAGYGDAYAAKGYFKLNADNSISLVSSAVAGWGDALSALVGGVYDPVAKSIYWDAQYAGMSFFVTQTKN